MKPLILLVTCLLSASFATGQVRDYLTDEEIELVRDAQQIDKRIEVLTHAIDRRFAALKINVSAPTKKLDAAAWGAAPGGTKAQLLYDIKRLLQKAVEDIDNLSARPDSLVIDQEAKKKPDGFNQLFPRAVRALAAAAERYKTPLKNELDMAGSGPEKGSVLDSLDLCHQITAAVAKLPKDASTTKKN